MRPITSKSSVVPICFGIYSSGNALIGASSIQVRVSMSNRKDLVKSKVRHVKVGPRLIRNKMKCTLVQAAYHPNGVRVSIATSKLQKSAQRVMAQECSKMFMPRKCRIPCSKSRRRKIIMGTAT